MENWGRDTEVGRMEEGEVRGMSTHGGGGVRSTRGRRCEREQGRSW